MYHISAIHYRYRLSLLSFLQAQQKIEFSKLTIGVKKLLWIIKLVYGYIASGGWWTYFASNIR